MPHLSLSISPGGPIVQLRIGVSRPRAAALIAAGQGHPQPIPINGLIDTGASCTCIDSSILRQLAIPSTGIIHVHTPSTQAAAPHVANVYDISLVLVHPLMTRTWHALPILESHLFHQGIQALIGRDILAQCVLTYDGSGGNFCLCF